MRAARFRSLFAAGLVALATVAPMSTAQAAPVTRTATIDFTGLAGFVSSVSSQAGISGDAASGSVRVHARNPKPENAVPGFTSDSNAAMIFDASCGGANSESQARKQCTGGDHDLWQGHMGMVLGNVLIVSEDGDASDPDDADVAHAPMIFDFSGFAGGVVTIESMTLVDVEADETAAEKVGVRAWRNGQERHSSGLEPTGDRAARNETLKIVDVDRFEVKVHGSGAIDNIRISWTEDTTCEQDPNQPKCDPCVQDPNQPSCDPCVQNPNQPSCDPCVQNPNQPSCDPCRQNPDAPECRTGEPEVEVLKSASPAGGTTLTAEGARITYTVTARNIGTADAEGVVVTDQLTGRGSVIAVEGCPTTPAWTADSARCSFPRLAPGAQGAFTVVVELDALPEGIEERCLANVATTSFADGNATNNRSAIVTHDCDGGGTSTEFPDLAVEKTSSLADALIDGDRFTYDLVVTNVGEAPARDVRIVDTFTVDDFGGIVSAELLLDEITGCDAVAFAIDGFTCAIDFLNVASAVRITVPAVVTITRPGLFEDCVVNVASVEAALDDNPANDISEPVTHDCGTPPELQHPDLEVVKRGLVDGAPSVGNASLGQTLTWQVVVTNTGEQDLTNVRVSDRLELSNPSAATVSFDVGNVQGCPGAVQEDFIGVGGFTCAIPSLTVGQTVTITYTTVATYVDPALCPTLTNTATGEPVAGEDNTADNTSVVSVVLDPGTTCTGYPFGKGAAMAAGVLTGGLVLVWMARQRREQDGLLA